MIAEVYNTVLAIINKENNGYVTPFEFNLFAKQAQLEIFEEAFNTYTTGTVKVNLRMFGTGHADQLLKASQTIDIFTVPAGVVTFGGGVFPMPPSTYKLNFLRYQGRKIEMVAHNSIDDLIDLPDMAPTTLFPVFTVSGTNMTVYPTTIQTGVTANYIRYPADPKWTYVSVPGSDAPLFNPAANDYQDFELPTSDMMNLIIRICALAGVSIREEQVVAAAKSEEIQDKQEM